MEADVVSKALQEEEHATLPDELIKMQIEDQAARIKLEKNWTDRDVANAVKAIDTKNVAQIKIIVDRIGWPTKQKVGPKAATAAWLIVQHADSDPSFQRNCLELMHKLNTASKGTVSNHDVVYLTDRVLVNEGKKQKFGTQMTMKDGVLVPRPIFDEEHVDERRKSMGLPTIEESLIWSRNHAKESHKTP